LVYKVRSLHKAAIQTIVEKAKFVVNEEKRIISGPAMIADMPLYRNDKELGEYYVIFDKAAIQSIVVKFSAKGYLLLTKKKEFVSE
jgi:hypothetical protein